MLNQLAHAGHSHDITSVNGMSDIEHCTPIVIGAGILIIILLLAIVYFLVAWQPKRSTVKNKKKT